jgi:hypothetical protein
MTFLEGLLDVLISLIPPALMGVLFWIMLRSILRADRKERDVYAALEAEERTKRANALGEQP